MAASSDSTEIEMAILGQVLVDRDFADEALPVLRPDMVTDARNQVLLSAILALWGARGAQAPDQLAVAEYLHRQGRLDRAGGMEHLVQVTGTSHTLHDFARHLEQLVSRAEARRYHSLYSQAQQRLAAGDAPEAVHHWLSDSIASGTVLPAQVPNLADHLATVLEQIEAAGRRQGIPGLPTGSDDLDERLLGLNKGNLILVGGRPGTGKSVVGLDFARANAKVGNGVLVWNLEMTTEEMLLRLLSAETYIDHRRLKTGNLDDNQWARLSATFSEVSSWPLIPFDRRGTVADLRRVASLARQQLRRENKDLRLIVVDYLQLVQPIRSTANRAVDVGSISQEFKGLAKELDVPLVALSQLNRNAADPNRKPMLTDLRESGSLEQDSDSVILLHRPHAIDTDNPAGSDEIEYHLAKNRHGQAGAVVVRGWLGKYMCTDAPPRRAMSASAQGSY